MDDRAQWFEPGEDAYSEATSPRNATATQRPAAVARTDSAAGVAAVVREAADRGLRVLAQGTGHGAGGTVGDDTVLLDTSALDSLSVDAEAGTATAGAGLTWGRVNAVAERHGMLGLAGSSPNVGIAGYTFGGGIGWLCRPHGLASAALRRVHYVDGAGDLRIAADDAADELDRDAIFAFRGGGGVGIATSLEFDLVRIGDLRAGFLLWPVEQLDAVIDAWASAIGEVGDDVATSVSVLSAPPAPTIPESVRGRRVVHLALAAGDDEDGARVLLDAVRRAGTAVVDHWGPTDAAGLSAIHLDPPAATPAIGIARWLTDATPTAAAAVLGVAAAPDSPLAMLEIRSVGRVPAARPGALTTTTGPFVDHAVGPLTSPEARPRIEEAFAEVRRRGAGVDAGHSIGSWVDGATSVPDALTADVRQRVATTANSVDPSGTVWRSRYLDQPARPSR